MQTNDDPNKKRQRNINLAIASIIGQVGILTLVIILGSLLGGLWLDNHFQTRPTFTIILIVASIPISIGVMLYISLTGAKKIQNQTTESKKMIKEVSNIGTREDT